MVINILFKLKYLLNFIKKNIFFFFLLKVPNLNGICKLCQSECFPGECQPRNTIDNSYCLKCVNKMKFLKDG